MNNCSSLFVLDTNQNSIEIIKSYLSEFGYADNVNFYTDYNLAIEQIKELEGNPIIFVDITNYNKKLISILETLKLYSTRIIITSADYSTNTIVNAMRLGAREFLPKPILKDDLKRVLTLLCQQDDNINDTASKVITIYSNKGGIGKTTIATNLAVELAKTTRDKVALIDLNLQLGDVSTFMNINPSFDVGYVIKNMITKKDESILNAFEKYKDTSLYILSDPSYIEQSESITPQHIDNLFKVLKRVFSYIIIDMSSNIDPNSLKILDNSDWILFTTIVNIPAIRNTQRCLNLFKSRRYPNNKIKIVLNRYMENEEISVEDIETTLGEKIYWKIPNNYFSVMESINKGVTVSEINSNSNIANNFKDLAIKIADNIVEDTITKYRGR